MCLAALPSCGGTSPDETALGSVELEIVGGVEVKPQGGAFVAALFQDFGAGFLQYCGGTFIAEDVVLTAAHCSAGIRSALDSKNQLALGPAIPSTLRVARRPMSLSAVDDLELIEVESVFVHPDFDWVSLDNDIAVWKLASSSPGQVVPLAHPAFTANLESSGTILKTFGYGVTDVGTGEDSNVPMRVAAPTVALAECRSAHYEDLGGSSQPLAPEEIVTSNMICVGTTGKDSCEGDGGGPLTTHVKVTLVGVASWGSGCGSPGLPGVYTRVANYLAWVAECQVGTCESAQPFSLCMNGFSDCDGSATNGCEANTLGAKHCGACGVQCDAGNACVYDYDEGESSARCAPAQPLKPRLECVYDPGGGSPRVVSFGYQNDNVDTIFVRRGANNIFHNVPRADTTYFGFPGVEEFRPGRYVNVVAQEMGSKAARWRVAGPDGVARQVTVSSAAKVCATNPLDAQLDQPRTAAERRYQAWKALWDRAR